MTAPSVAQPDHAFPFVPRLRLFVEPVLVDRSDGLRDRTAEEKGERHYRAPHALHSTGPPGAGSRALWELLVRTPRRPSRA